MKQEIVIDLDADYLSIHFTRDKKPHGKSYHFHPSHLPAALKLYEDINWIPVAEQEIK